MPGQHIDRVARAEMTGLTESQRDEMIVRLRGAGWSQHKIAKYLGMTQAGVSHAIKRISGARRVQIKYAACDECGLNFPKGDVVDGLCPTCQ